MLFRNDFELGNKRLSVILGVNNFFYTYFEQIKSVQA